MLISPKQLRASHASILCIEKKICNILNRDSVQTPARSELVAKMYAYNYASQVLN